MSAFRVFFGLFAAFFLSTQALAFPAKLGVGPDNNHALLSNTIRSARSRLDINIYQLESQTIAKTLIGRIQKGIQVRLLIEAQPFGSMSAEGIQILEQIRDEMSLAANKGNHLYLMYRKFPGGDRRFVYNHAKYIVVDGKKVWISSENFTNKGHALPGYVGNRGWDTVLSDLTFATQMTKLFEQDADPALDDVLEVGPGDAIPGSQSDSGGPTPDEGPMASNGKLRTLPPIAEAEGQIESVTLVTSPLANQPLIDLIRSAKSHLSVEHMSLPSVWYAGPNPYMSPLVAELIAAAERGVHVRVLLNDNDAFGRADQGSDKSDDGPGRLRNQANSRAYTLAKPANEITVELLNSLRQQRQIPLFARIINVERAQISYIHNKGILVDSDLTLVSSINGSRNSVHFNREVAVLLKSRDANAYYGGAFDFDWNQSEVPASWNENPLASLTNWFFLQLH